jgi:predicted AlkP superfamily phosphohydrolase/phosphomutase
MTCPARATLALLLAALPACERTGLADVEPLDRKVLFLGIDGLDYGILKPVLEHGDAPALADLRRRGILVPLIGERANIDPYSTGVDPAESWTTIATGFPPTRIAERGGANGVRNVTVPVKGRYEELPVTSQHRRLPNFWDVLSAAGVRCAIVGWWSTWPAEPVNGFLVSDRFFLERFGLTGFGPAGRVDLPPVPASYRQGALHLTWPEALSDELFRELEPGVRSPSVPLVPWLGQARAAARDATTRDSLAQVEQALRTDLAVKESLLAILRRDPSIRFAACYLDALDVASHLFWMHIDPQAWLQHKDPAIRRKLPQDHRAYSTVIPAVAMAIDRIVKELCDAMGQDAIVLLVNDHTLEPDVEAANRDFSLNGMLEELGFLARGPDGSIDWARSVCFDHTAWPRVYRRDLALNVEGEWPQGCVRLESPQERAVHWRRVQETLMKVKVSPPYPLTDKTTRDDLFWKCEMGEADSHFTIVPILRGDVKLKLPAREVVRNDVAVKLPAREFTMDQLFPPRPTSARHSDPGMLLLSYAGERGERHGRRGVPMGKGGGQSRHVAPLVLGLFGIPCSQREDESASNADFLYWILDLEEAQRLVLMPRVESYEERVRFQDPTSLLGGRRRELERYVRELGYDFESARTLEQLEPMDDAPTALR